MSKKYIDFLGQKNIALFCSALLIGLTVYQWISTGPSKYGIDFVGGTEVVVRLAEPSNVADIKSVVEKSGVPSVTVQAFEFGSSEFSIRAGEQAGMDHKALAEKISNSEPRTQNPERPANICA